MPSHRLATAVENHLTHADQHFSARLISLSPSQSD